MLATPGCQVNCVDARGRTAIVVALKCKHSAIASMLLEAHCAVDSCDHHGAAPILHATSLHDATLCKTMLTLRADMNARDPADGRHIMHLAVQAHNDPLVQALLEARADIHARSPTDGKAVLHIAATLRRGALVRRLLELRAEADAQSTVGDTPLRLA